jgi:hypothetical protein
MKRSFEPRYPVLTRIFDTQPLESHHPVRVDLCSLMSST